VISFSIHALFFPGKSEKEKKGEKKEEERTRQWQLSNSEDGHKTPTTTTFIRVFTIFYWPPGCRNLPRSQQHFNFPQLPCPSNRQKSPITTIAPAASRPPSPIRIREIRAYVPGRKEKKRDNATRETLRCCNKQKQKSKKEKEKGGK